MALEQTSAELLLAASDGDPRALYFRQAHNGVPTRQALLGLVTGAIR